MHMYACSPHQAMLLNQSGMFFFGLFVLPHWEKKKHRCSTSSTDLLWPSLASLEFRGSVGDKTRSTDLRWMGWRSIDRRREIVFCCVLRKSQKIEKDVFVFVVGGERDEGSTT